MVKVVGSCAYYNNYLALTRLIPKKKVNFWGGPFDVAENTEGEINRFTGPLLFFWSKLLVVVKQLCCGLLILLGC